MNELRNLEKEAREIRNFIRLTIKVLLLIVFLLVSFTLVFSVYRAMAQPSNINFSIAEYDLADITNPSLNQTFNIRNQTTITTTNTFNATYSFTDDIVGNEPIGWTCTAGAGLSYNILNEYALHGKVWDIYDNSATLQTVAYNDTEIDAVYGVVDIWIRTTSIVADTGIVLSFKDFDVPTTISMFRFKDDGGQKIQVRDGGSWVDVQAASVNVWYHFSIVFDCITDKWDLYIDGQFDDNYDFQVGLNNIDGFQFATGAVWTGHAYIDALGFNWSYYNQFDNLFPLYNSSVNNYEVDRFEFALEGVDNFYDVGDDNPSGWVDDEYPTKDDVNIALGSEPNIDREVYFYGKEQTCGLYKDFSNSNSYVYNLTFGLTITDLSDTYGNFIPYIKTNDSSVVQLLKIYNNDNLYNALAVYDRDSWRVVSQEMEINKYLEFNIYINYYSSFALLTYYREGVYNDTFLFALSQMGDSGLSQIYFDAKTPEAATMFNKYYLDYVGIYENGKSLSDDYGFCTIDLTQDKYSIWYLERANLFNITAFGNMSLYALVGNFFNGLYYPEGNGLEAWLGIDLITSIHLFNNTPYFENLYELESIYDEIVYPQLLIYVNNKDMFNISVIDINGVNITQNGKQYYFEYEYSGMNPDENYFYAVGNIIYFTHTSDNNETLEYMSATVNIDNFNAYNYSFSYKGYCSPFAEGYGQIIFTDITSSSLKMNTFMTTKNVLLPPTKVVDKFSIIITDNNDISLGNSSGSITDISFIYIPNYAVTITTLSFMEIIVPLIVLLAPSILIGSRKKFGKHGFMIVFSIMSVVCFIGNLIPLWIFLILIICIGTYSYIQLKSDY